MLNENPTERLKLISQHCTDAANLLVTQLIKNNYSFVEATSFMTSLFSSIITGMYKESPNLQEKITFTQLKEECMKWVGEALEASHKKNQKA